MGNAKKYVVWKGRTPGVYDSWAECERQVKGVSAVFKAYQGISDAEAQAIFEAGSKSEIASYGQKEAAVSGGKRGRVRPTGQVDLPKGAWAVDAATSHNPGPMEYRGVDVDTGEVLFASKVYPVGTNNIGEFLAIVHAVALMRQRGERHTLFSDSRNAISWVKQGTCKTKLERTDRTEELFRVLDRAVAYLRKHSLEGVDLRKWPTDIWGEIPADYGRK